MAELIVAFDTSDKSTLVRWAGALRGATPWAKVGLEALTSLGHAAVRHLKKQQFRIFVDMKLFDIPNTVARSVYAAAGHADMLTLHTLGGERMLRAARNAADDAASEGKTRPLLLGVTVLTSMGQGDLPFYSGPVDDLVLRLAQVAQQAGMDGVVCSAHEVAAIKARCGNNFLCVTPGIRPADTEKGDQARTMTPAEAVNAGADFLVVGRPVTQAADPAAAARAILHDMKRIEP